MATYVLQPGDSPASVARKILGSESATVDVIRANPGLYNWNVGVTVQVPDSYSAPTQTQLNQAYSGASGWDTLWGRTSTTSAMSGPAGGARLPNKSSGRIGVSNSVKQSPLPTTGQKVGGAFTGTRPENAQPIMERQGMNSIAVPRVGQKAQPTYQLGSNGQPGQLTGQPPAQRSGFPILPALAQKAFGSTVQALGRTFQGLGMGTQQTPSQMLPDTQQSLQRRQGQMLPDTQRQTSVTGGRGTMNPTPEGRADAAPGGRGTMNPTQAGRGEYFSQQTPDGRVQPMGVNYVQHIQGLGEQFYSIPLTGSGPQYITSQDAKQLATMGGLQSWQVNTLMRDMGYTMSRGTWIFTGRNNPNSSLPALQLGSGGGPNVLSGLSSGYSDGGGGGSEYSPTGSSELAKITNGSLAFRVASG